jgi:hypothetical protein
VAAGTWRVAKDILNAARIRLSSNGTSARPPSSRRKLKHLKFDQKKSFFFQKKRVEEMTSQLERRERILNLELSVQNQTSLAWEIIFIDDASLNWRLSFPASAGRIDLLCHSNIDEPDRLWGIRFDSYSAERTDAVMEFLRCALDKQPFGADKGTANV